MKKYNQKLIELAEEIKDIQDDKGGWLPNKLDVLTEKMNYLIGYILAYKEIRYVNEDPD